MFASQRHVIVNGKQVPLRLSYIDIKKTYLNGIPTRNIFMSLANQTRCVYGTRDMGMIWEQCYRNAVETMGFKIIFPNHVNLFMLGAT